MLQRGGEPRGRGLAGVVDRRAGVAVVVVVVVVDGGPTGGGPAEGDLLGVGVGWAHHEVDRPARGPRGRRRGEARHLGVRLRVHCRGSEVSRVRVLGEGSFEFRSRGDYGLD